METYEVWSDEDGVLTYGSKANMESMKEKGFISDTSILLHSFESTDYNSAMNTVHELMGWEPYIPMKDEE
jgi:hypothetical protein